MGIRAFQKMIFSWWHTHRRDLPWRVTRDPYHILVSEVMLQQTQVRRVIAKYTEFIERYPTVYDLSKASPADVLRVWKGMGYNRRALYLQQTAKAVVKNYGGEFPQDEVLLTKLPGLGRYTARALLVFAFGKDVAMVDTNIRQIITHFFYNDAPQHEKVIQETADQLLPHGKSWEWHQALMDYGALELSRIKGREQRVENKDKRIKKKIIPFHKSNRFYRGRIVDYLREGNIKETTLIKEFVKKYDKPVSFFSTVIAGLIKDGLVVRSAGMLHLPE